MYMFFFNENPVENGDIWEYFAHMVTSPYHGLWTRLDVHCDVTQPQISWSRDYLPQSSQACYIYNYIAVLL